MAKNEDEDEVTHGEAWFLKARDKEMKTNGYGYCLSITGLPNRMGYKEAAIYYTKKVRGYFEQRLTIKNFDKVEDYFGYYEAIKIRNLIEKL